MRSRVVLGLVAAVALDTVVQLLWKYAVDRVPESAGAGESLRLVLHQPLAYLVIALFVVQFANWMTVLASADLSFAQPITALSYVTVGAGSAWLFHEHLSARWTVGVAMILAGVWLVSGSGRTTDRQTIERAAAI